MQTVRKLYAPLEKLDGLLGVWERIPRLVKAALRTGIYYIVVQIGLAYGARALDVGRENWYFVVIPALVVTLIITLLVEHFVFTASPPAGSVYVPEDEAVLSKTVAGPILEPDGSLELLIEESDFKTAACTTGHQILEDSIELDLSFIKGIPSMSKITCIVVDPSGVNTSAEHESLFSLNVLNLNSALKLTNPSNFPGGTRLRTGAYSVTWLSEKTLGLSSLFARPHTIARDSFTVRMSSE